MDRNSFLCEIGQNILKHVAEDVQTRFDARGYSKDGNRHFLIGKNEKVKC